MRRADVREALGYCAETCPQVDGAFSDMSDDLLPLVAVCKQEEAEQLISSCLQAVKDKGTLLLRDALEKACADKQEAESDRDELEREVRNLRDEVASLKSEIESLEAEASA